MTRLDGYASSSSKVGDTDAAPGATFHVLDDRTGGIVAMYASESAAVGLPADARIRLAERRAAEHADRLNAASSTDAAA